MAPASNVLRTCGLLLNLIFQVNFSAADTSNLFIQTLEVGSILCDNITCKYLLTVTGSEFLGYQPWRLTSEEGVKGSKCEKFYPNYELKEIETSQWMTKIEVSIPNIEGKIFFCLRENGKNAVFGGLWSHQGVQHYLEPKKDVSTAKEKLLAYTTESNSNSFQGKENLQETQNLGNLAVNNETQEANTDWADLTHDIDVNYLPSARRPTREEKNDIEILVNNTYVPLNDLRQHIDLDSDKSIDFIDNHDKNYIDNEIATFIESSDLNKDKLSEEEVLNSMEVEEKLNYAKEVIDKIDAIVSKLQSDKSSREENTKKIAEEAIASDIVFEGNANSLPNYKAPIDREEIFENEYESSKGRVDLRQILDKLDELLAKVVTMKCVDTQDSSDMSTPNMPTSDKDLPAMYTSHILSSDMHIPDDVIEGFSPKLRIRRQVPEVDFTSVKGDKQRIVIEGLRIEDSDKDPKIIEDGIPSVLADSAVTLRVYGDGLTARTVIAFTHDAQQYGQPCKFLIKGEYVAMESSLQFRTALFHIRAPAPITGSKLYICAKNLQYNRDTTNDEEKYLHQGTETWKMLASHNNFLPLWVSVGLILFCLMFSALFSGLNLGLMSLDRTELKIISNTGTEQERKYARAIMPVRDHGNYLLCSILLGNVAVNSTFTILLDELTSGLFAVIFSTLAIVLLGEITPQAICSRHGLMVGAKTIFITKGVMAVTAPLSFPVSKLLDYFLGEEIGNVYNRERLKELVKVTTDVNDLDKDEVNIISGALEMRKKIVKDVMTKLEDAFMLPISSVLDFETMSEIVKSGYSRIPVYEGGRGNIVTVLFIKDLAFVDPDDNTPLRTLCQYYQNAAHFVFEDVTLDIMFKQFKDGHKGHMAFVHRINNEGEGDPFYETIGLVTLEDVIEEMIQSEIVDETDVFLDNRSKRRRRPQNKLQDFAAFAERHEHQRIHISPQLTLATFQFLNTSVDAFRPELVSETVLRRLLRQDVIQHIKIKEKTKRDPSTYVFQQGKPVDYFVLILEGRVEVTVGRENLVFEAGPFTYFGVQALMQNVGVAESPTPSAMGSLQNINMDAMLRHTFVPDYSVRAITSVFYLTVKRSLYLAAKRATLMEKGNISKGGTTQEFDTEVDKLLQSVDEDLSITGEHKTPSRQVSPNPMPVSPAPRVAETRNGHAYAHTNSDEQERLLK